MLELSQTDLAQALGTSVEQIQDYEDGSRQITTNHINGLATLLKVSPSFFLKPVSPEKAVKDLAALRFPDEVMDFLTSPDGLLLMAAYMQIKDHNIRRSIVQFIEQLARWEKGPGLNWLN